MKKILITLLMLITLISFGFAEPQIIDIQTPENIFYGEAADFNIIFDSNGQTGTMNFWDNETIQEQRLFAAGTTFMTFSKTWTNLGERQIKASLTGLSGIDINYTNNILDKNILVSKGIDFEISALTAVPESVLPSQTITISAFIQNNGDYNFVGETLVTFYYDSNYIGETTLTNLNLEETKEITLDYLIPENFDGTATIMAQINKINNIKEFDITNNNKLLDLSEESGINLKINSLTYEGNITKGVMKEFTIFVENNGGKQANAFTIGIYKGVISESTKIGNYNVNSLNGKTVQEVKFSTFFSESGEQKILVFVDPLNKIPEFNETDNDYEITINVEDSNSSISIGEYLSTIDTYEINISNCKADLTTSRLERDVALDNIKALTKERDNCTSNLNVCNENNTTFFVESLNEIRETTQKDSNLTQDYYFTKMLEKDNDIKDIKAEANQKVKEAQEYGSIGYAFAALLIIIFVGNFLVTIQKKRTTRLE